jgi:hypothetical protein
MHAEERGGNTERIVRTKVMEGMLSILLLCEPKLDMPSLMYPVWTTWEGRHNWRHIVFFIPLPKAILVAVTESVDSPGVSISMWSVEVGDERRLKVSNLITRIG